MDNYNDEFSGVFNFTNPDNEEFVALWNNKEYRFAPESTSPLLIASEPLENIQEIRKRFAYRNAEKRFYKSPEYMKMKDMGNGIPPTFDPKILEPMIQECLKPLPIKRAVVKEGKKIDDERNYKHSKAIGQDEDPNYIFREDNVDSKLQKLGKV